MSECLYVTLVADGSLSTPVVDNYGMLQNQITSEIDKYLQEAAERCEKDDNYFDSWHMATNTSSPQQEANFLEQDEEDDEARILESNDQDTSVYGTSPTEHDTQYQDELETIPEEEEDPQMAEKQDIDNPDMVAYTSRSQHQITDIMNAMYDSVTNDNFDGVSDDTDRVSGVVDNDYDKKDNDND